MRFSLVGVDAQGRSTVVSTKTIEFPADADSLAVEHLWSQSAETGGEPLAHPPESHWMDLEVSDGAVRWIMWRLPPNSVSGMHHTDTVDCQVVLAGEVTCVLGAGEVRLGPGDAILIPGLEHQWAAGPQGCNLSGVVRGLPARPPS